MSVKYLWKLFGRFFNHLDLPLTVACSCQRIGDNNVGDFSKKPAFYYDACCKHCRCQATSTT